MEYICIGKIITTHGLKGEMKLRSLFEYKDKVFKVGNLLYFGDGFERHEILSYRHHQDYDMVIVNDIDTIDKAILYKQKKVYITRDLLDEEDILNSDLIGLKVMFENSKIGYVLDVVDYGNNVLLKLSNGKYIPKNNNFISKIDLKNKTIILQNVEGLL